MKYILGVLCFCFLATYSSAANAEPLCNMRTMLSNETWLMQTFYGLFRGDRRALECLAGCGIYTFDSTFGGFMKNIAGPVYAFFENCVKAGQRSHNTCQITDCVINLLLMGIDFVRTMNIKIPFIDQFEWLLSHRKSQYTVDGAGQQNNGQQPILAYPSAQIPVTQAPLPQQTPAPPPPPPPPPPAVAQPQPQSTQEPHRRHKESSAPRVIPTLVLLQVCGYFFFKQFIF